jgi:hypothetical protein
MTYLKDNTGQCGGWVSNPRELALIKMWTYMFVQISGAVDIEKDRQTSLFKANVN